MNDRYLKARSDFAGAGQGQIFRFWDALSLSERSGLLEDAAAIDPREVNALADKFLRAKRAAVDLDGLAGAPFVPHPKHGGDPAQWAQAFAEGERALRAGRVACFTVAGGQGTRLGFSGPKGAFPVTVLRRKTLFQVFAEKIRAARARYGAPIPWFIMTSRQNHDRTVAFFREHDHFGLGENGVFFFKQGMMPSVGADGKILLETKGRVALSPDGHGGSLRALVRSGATEKMRAMGIDLVSYFQVDNPLIHCVDPAFIGFHLLGNSEMSGKALVKTDPAEKVGHFCLRRGRACVVEYSDLPDALARERDADGALKFRAGSIAIHIFSRDFIERMGGDGAERLPFHCAHKKVPHVDADGAPVVPDAPNAYKFEMFVFDAIEYAKNPVIVETLREEEFSAVKNASGVDSPETCARAQIAQAARWLRAAGVPLETDAEGMPAHPIEISPLFADSAEALAAKRDRLKALDFSKPLYLGA